MGLAIIVGVYAEADDDPDWREHLDEELGRLNGVLAEHGVPRHRERDLDAPPVSRAICDGFPYAYLHYLRRVYAHVAADPEYVAAPLADGVDPTQDPILETAYSSRPSHLLQHSDCEGYYVPVDFNDVIFCDEKVVAGGMIGSSYQLRKELMRCARALGIQLDGTTLSDVEAERVNALAEESPLGQEYMAWIALFEAARLSIENRVVITFS